MNNEKSRSVYFDNLDGFRFIAFLGVFIHHAFTNFGPALPLENVFINTLFQLITQQGENGVSFFFVISGFLISFLLFKEKKETNKIRLRHFYWRRALRIWPLYFIVLFAGFIILPTVFSEYTDLNENWLYYVFFAGNFDQFEILNSGRSSFNVIGVTWSIAIEEQFYIIWPLIIKYIPRKGILWVFAGLFIFAMVFRMLHFYDKWILYLHSFSVFSDFIIGACLAYLAVFRKDILEQAKTIKPYFIHLAYFIGFSFMITEIYLPQLKSFRLILPLFWCFIIWEQNYYPKSIYKISNNKLFSRLGGITYGLYLYHSIVLLLVYQLSRAFFPVVKMPAEILITGVSALILSVLISHISFKYLEKPILNFKNRLPAFRLK